MKSNVQILKDDRTFLIKEKKERSQGGRGGGSRLRRPAQVVPTHYFFLKHFIPFPSCSTFFSRQSGRDVRCRFVIKKNYYPGITFFFTNILSGIAPSALSIKVAINKNELSPFSKVWYSHCSSLQSHRLQQGLVGTSILFVVIHTSLFLFICKEKILMAV